MSTPETLEALERRLLSAEVRRSRDALERLIAEDFTEFGASGRRWTKADVLRSLPATDSPEPADIAALEVKVLGEDLALVTYELTEGGVEGRRTLRSSLWRRHGDGWQIVFHQGTMRTGGDSVNRFGTLSP